MIITQTSGLATMINVFEVEPAQQQHLVDIWLEEGKKFEAWPGFVSATLHRSLDGKRVLNYAQWQKAEDWQALAQQGAQLFARFKGVGKSDPHLYEIVYLSNAARTTQVTVDLAAPVATMINVFEVEPAQQQHLVDIWLEEGKKFEAWPGFVSATLHRSLDGKRVLNYAQWQKAEDWQALAQQGAQLFARFKGVGRADPHLYEIVYLSNPPQQP